MHVNLTAYDNFEEITDKEELLTYRKDKLHSVRKHVEFIRKEFNGRPINVTELGSGNCKLLIALEKASLLKKGIGLEISKSRHQFGLDWVAEEGCLNVTPLLQDVITFDYDSNTPTDLYLGLDILWQFLEPIKKGSALSTLKSINESLNDGGMVIMEFCDLERYFNTKVWEEFDESDPWRYSLWDCKYDNETKFLHWDKVFIARDDNRIDKKSIILKPYTKEDVTILFMLAGFNTIEFYDNWDGDEYMGSNFEYIVTARK